MFRVVLEKLDDNGKVIEYVGRKAKDRSQLVLALASLIAKNLLWAAPVSGNPSITFYSQNEFSTCEGEGFTSSHYDCSNEPELSSSAAL